MSEANAAFVVDGLSVVGDGACLEAFDLEFANDGDPQLLSHYNLVD